MRLFGLSKASVLAWSRPTGPERPSMTLLEFLPHFALCSDRGKNASKTNVAWLRNCPYHQILTLFPEIAHNEQLIILWLWVPQHAQENKLLPIQSISSSHRAQVITPCSTSLQQILSVTDRATLLFSVERISKGFFFLFDSFSVVKDLPDNTWGDGIDLTFYSAILQHFFGRPFSFC